MSMIRRIKNVMQQYQNTPEVAYLLTFMLKDTSDMNKVGRVFDFPDGLTTYFDDLNEAQEAGRKFQIADKRLAQLYEDWADDKPELKIMEDDELCVNLDGDTELAKPTIFNQVFGYVTMSRLSARVKGRNFKWLLNGAARKQGVNDLFDPRHVTPKSSLRFRETRVPQYEREDHMHAYLRGVDVLRARVASYGKDFLLRRIAQDEALNKLEKLLEKLRMAQGDAAKKNAIYAEMIKLRRESHWEDEVVERAALHLFVEQTRSLWVLNTQEDFGDFGEEPYTAVRGFFQEEDFAPGQYDVVIPWLAKVLNAWIKAADRLTIPMITHEDTALLPCVQRPKSNKISDFVAESATNPANKQYVDLANTLFVHLIRSAVHHKSLSVLHENLGKIVEWVNDPSVKVDLLRLSVGDAYRAAKAHTARAMLMADKYEDSSVLYRDATYVFVDLTSKYAIIREGEVQEHCVGTYCDKVAAGKTQIVSMRTIVDNKRIATIEVDLTTKGKRIVRQVFKSANRTITDPVQRMAVAKFIKYVNAEVGDGYMNSALPYQAELDQLAAQPEGDVLAGLWDLALDGGIHGFVANFGRR